MKAIVFEEVGKIVLKEVEVPTLAEDEVLVKIKSAALNHRDVWIRKGMYAGIRPNVILGSDGCGTVAAVGKNIDYNLTNKAVILDPGSDWGDNQKVQSKDYKILGLPENGTLAEYVKIKAKYIKAKPEHLSFETAGALALAGLTAYRAVFTRGQIEKTDKVLITGIGGGVALFAFQFALAMGCQVYVTSGSNEKINKALNLGAKQGVNYKEDNWEKEFNTKFDLIIDSACGNDFTKLVDLAQNGGRIVFFGGTTGSINKLVPQKVFWKQLSILGSTMGSHEEFSKMVEFVEEKKIVPIVDQVFEAKDYTEAFDRMDNSQQFGKIVVNF